jgi:cobyrinic acid a,c-diamide synthase
MVSIPRVVIAAPSSGSGKTSIATGLLAAFRARGLTMSPHKVGPDYIDPGYHTLAAGRPGRNLDPWLVGEERIAPMFLHGAMTPSTADLAIIEGVMGLFDGASGQHDFASTAHVARLLGAPIVLVVDASGAARSVAALVHGFISFDPTIRIGGVIFNRVGSPGHAAILRDALEPMGVAVLGTVLRQDELSVPSRHLGLIPAAERSSQAREVVDRLGAAISEQVDLDAVHRLARSAAALDLAPAQPTSPSAQPPVRIAIAAGPAFTFGYAEHPELLLAAGAELVKIDPTREEALPPDVAGLVIGGGFPEVHAADLSANDRLRESITALARSGAPIVAECAGLLYLARSLDGHPMCGILDVDAVMESRLTLGYRDAVAPVDSVLAAAGTRVHGHEFHRTVTTPRHGAQAAWQWRREGVVSDGFVQGGVHASYLHVHWSGLAGAASRFVAAARAYQPVAA